MFDKLSKISFSKYQWANNKPLIRYVLGISFVLAISSLLNYQLSYLTTVLALGYIAPGVKPLSIKQGVSFIVSIIIIILIVFAFSIYFIDYLLVFIPIQALVILWLYYTDKLALMVKLFAIISIFVIPLLTLQSNILGGLIAQGLIINVFMSILLTQIVFWVLPWSSADEIFVKAQAEAQKPTEAGRFKYALNILIILMPVVLLFFFLELSGALLILIYIALLSMNPATRNLKVGKAMIIANLVGGLFAIVAYQLLTVIPMLFFMVLITVWVGFLFGGKLFSTNKLASLYGSGFSTFLLILGSVTSSDAEASGKVWTRVIQIGIAVIYVVVAFGLLQHYEQKKRKKLNAA